MGAVLLYPLVLLAEPAMQWIFERMEDPRYGSLLASVFLFMIPTVILGMISPYSVRLLVDTRGEFGTRRRRLYFVSTLGSALGTLATSFYLRALVRDQHHPGMPHRRAGRDGGRRTRSARTSWELASRGWHVRLVPLWIMLSAGLALFSPLVHADRILHEERSLYSRIMVRESAGVVCLQFSVRHSQRNQTCMNPKRPRELLFAYTRMAMTSLLYTPEPTAILVVGLGGGTLPMAFVDLFPGVHIDAIEIDPAVVAVAHEYFGFEDGEHVVVHTRDARVWTKRALAKPRRYDIIVLDAFNGEYIPEHLMTREYLEETKALLAPGGTLIANTFAISDLYHSESATYAAVFGDFINFRVPESANRVIVVPPVVLTRTELRARAKAIAPRLKPFKVQIERLARALAALSNEPPDWDKEARVLTDQYAPANLLQGE